MKLLIITSAIVRGGAEEYVLAIAIAATQAGWNTHVALPQAEGNATLRHTLAENHVLCDRLEITEQRHRGLQAMMDAVVQCLRTCILLLAVKPDVVLINLPWADHCLGSLIACAWLQQPTAAMFHLLPPEGIPLSRSRRRLYTWARNRHQQWLTNSKINCQSLATLFQIPLSDLLYIYNGIKLPTLLDRDAEAIAVLRQQVRQELGLPATSKLLLTASRLAPQKGYEDLISAIPSLVESHPDVWFVWAGEGEQRQALCDRLHDAGIADKVLMLGHRSDLPRLLQAADLFVFPTRFEGHPFALLEAMASGLPIVTTDASSIPEMMEHQVHGLLCGTGDSEALFQSLHWALQHPDQMQTMAQKAEQNVQRFTQASMTEKTLTVLQRLSLFMQPTNVTQQSLNSTTKCFQPIFPNRSEP